MSAQRMSNRPAPTAPRAYSFPAFTRHAMANGVSLVFAPVTKLPLVSMVVLVDAGAALDQPGHDGLAALTGSLLLEGTMTRDGAALADAFEQLGATVDVVVGWDSAIVQLTVLKHHADAAMQLLGEVVRTPGFREQDVARLRAERLAERLQVRTEPRELAEESFARFLYAPRSRYALPEGGGTASVEAMTADDIRKFHRAWYGPGRTTVIIVGDVSPDHAASLAQRGFGDWVAATVVPPGLDDSAQPGGRRIQVVNKAGAPQTELRIGHRGVPRAHPDYFKLVVMNAALGGLFSSRINLNLRERHGYTYGAHSFFDWRRGHGPFAVSTAVESTVTAAATREILTEIERIRDSAITVDELSLVTSYLAGVFPIRYETTAAIAGALSALVTYDHPADYFDTYREQVSAVSRDDVLDVARRHLRPDQLLILAAGDGATIEAPLRDLGVGDVTTTTADDEEGAV